MKIVIDIPNYYLNDIQNGSIACGEILKAVKNGKPYEERPQGKWVVSGLDYKCSNCGMIPIFRQYNFCPNCGADMRKEEEG